MVEELELGLSNEKPRNHLDMRHRLDSTGQRRGKASEPTRDKRGLPSRIDSNRKEWIKVDNWDNLTISKQEAKAYSKDLSNYCGRLLEETEDELAELIKKGSVRGGDVSKVLCQDLSAHCSRTSALHQGNGYGNESDGEL
ncbi:hypothetical protein Prudu_013290 [Prunus dulcis]|uniref:DUF3456 domain-containing protein n=1 Tax=Prunus dulcis TaxID=3755 RepID=A0A4Y1RFI0_PRUDU|nr:hypothetical protein Prudu_013290 [Prunus dulcis]